MGGGAPGAGLPDVVGVAAANGVVPEKVVPEVAAVIAGTGLVEHVTEDKAKKLGIMPKVVEA